MMAGTWGLVWFKNSRGDGLDALILNEFWNFIDNKVINNIIIYS